VSEWSQSAAAHKNSAARSSPAYPAESQNQPPTWPPPSEPPPSTSTHQPDGADVSPGCYWAVPPSTSVGRAGWSPAGDWVAAGWG